MNKHIGVNFKLDTVQAIRALMAILESSFVVHCPEEYKPVLEHLSRYFRINYEIGLEGIPIADVEIDHAGPVTRIGKVSRPPIFPHSAFEKCRARWMCDRPTYALFIGHMTDSRLAAFHKLPLSNPVVVISNNGRSFPAKAWDDSYYAAMSRAKFALCPDGDYVWTYRFFEAAMCGCIPVVEHDLELYWGFDWCGWEEVWDAGSIEKNFTMARDMLTVSCGELDRQLEAVL